MSYHTLFLLLFIAVWIIRANIGKNVNKKVKLALTVLAIFFLIIPFLPRLFFGKWNAISLLNDKEISQIRLGPSLPNWKVNLVGSDLVISDKQQIDTITQLLRKVDVYFPSHPIRVWETKMFLITTTRDTVEMKINNTNNNGTSIETPSNEWRLDTLGCYLEKLTKYQQPVYSDTVKPEPVNVGSQ
ncbi:hypothetical protein A3860_07370 [Niastella vici]|uniref:Uncharacterized protein n=1 Tax=Niastella vici TaxID=1703345 RepID=A0A1V9FIF7_9BACT|nr:hypothetical protein [Niastella vici]OQP58138.1 hypothetical protein A3860_07370 [Niastella vici]